MRVVFLDFDGVLNSWRYFKDAHTAGRALIGPWHQIDTKAVRWLNEIVQRSGAKVVVSSTWRILHALDDLAAWLKQAGFVGEVIGKTPDLSWRTVEPESKQKRSELAPAYVSIERGHEIDLWLQQNSGAVDAFVILDDGGDMAMHKPRLVQVDARKGLKPIHAVLALRLLGVEPEGNEWKPTKELLARLEAA